MIYCIKCFGHTEVSRKQNTLSHAVQQFLGRRPFIEPCGKASLNGFAVLIILHELIQMIHEIASEQQAGINSGVLDSASAGMTNPESYL